MDVQELVLEIGKKAKAAARQLAYLSTDVKNRVLKDVAERLRAERAFLQEENEKDLAAAHEKGLSAALIDRLTLSDKVIEGMAQGLEEVAALPDPVGEVVKMWRRPNGLWVGRMRIPLGVIAMIYESRPNVTIDAAGLCFKSGNAVILRGGSEAINSNLALARLFQEALAAAGAPEGAVQVIPVTDRAAVNELLKLEEFVDLIIP